MTMKAVSWAFELSLPSGHSSTKLTLVAFARLARAHDSDQLECWPSVGYLMACTGQDRKTVLRNIAKLVRWRLLADSGRRVGQTRKVIVYTLHCRERISTRCPQKRPQAEETDPKKRGNGPDFDAMRAQIWDTDKDIYIKKAKSRAHARAPARVRTATANSNAPGSGDVRKRTPVMVGDAIPGDLDRNTAQPAAAIDRTEAEPRAGGAA